MFNTKAEDVKKIADLEQLAEPEGTVLGKFENFSVCKKNENCIVIGSSGTGKTEFFAVPNVMTCISAGDPYFVFDLNGSVFSKTAKLAEKEGYDVKIFNLSTPTASDGWNPLAILKDLEGDDLQTKLDILIRTIMDNTDEGNDKDDLFFRMSSENLLKALVLYVAVSSAFEGGEEERNFGSVYDLLVKLIAQEGLLDEMDNVSGNDPAKIPWRIYQGGGKIKYVFAVNLLSRLRFLENEATRKILSYNEIDFSEKEKTAYYLIGNIIRSDAKVLNALFTSYALDQAMRQGMRFVLDEFDAIGRIYNSEAKLFEAKVRGATIDIIVQPGQTVEKLLTNQAAFHSCIYLASGVYNEKICSDLAKMINAFGASWTNEKITAEDLIKLFVSNEQARLIVKKGKKACLIEPYDNSFHKLSDDVMFSDPSDHIPGWTEKSKKQKYT